MYILKKTVFSLEGSEYNKIFSLLPASSQKRIERYRIENDKKRSLVGEYLVRMAVSEELHIPFSDIELLRTENGKPYLKGNKIHFSITHSGDLVAVAVSDKNIGIDAEKLRDIDLRIAEIAFTESEKEFLARSGDKILTFFRIWTSKEARIKAKGTNLSDLRSENFLDYENKCIFIRDGEYVITVYEE